MPRKSAQANLLELQESAAYLIQRTSDLTATQIADDFELSLFVERLLERIGETLRRLSVQNPEIASQIPDYRHAIAMRNIIAHAYYDIDWDRVRHTLDTSLPVLLATVKQILSDWPMSEENA